MADSRIDLSFTHRENHSIQIGNTIIANDSHRMEAPTSLLRKSLRAAVQRVGCRKPRSLRHLL